MNTPNKLTLLRVIMIPVFMVVYMYYNVYPIISAGIFALAFLTDMLDGYLARKNNQVSNFGKIMDPLADKVLVAAAMVLLTASGIVNAWVTVLVLAREFAVSGIRIAAAAEGNVVAASIWGKIKTIWQFIAITIALLLSGKNEIFEWQQLFIEILMWINLALTVLSGADYIIKNRKYISLK